jgi:DNA mismatch repair protein MutS
MAGMPSSLIDRANAILQQLEQHHVKEEGKDRVSDVLKQVEEPKLQLSIFDSHSQTFDQIRTLLSSIDINRLTPVEALMKLNEVKDLLQ